MEFTIGADPEFFALKPNKKKYDLGLLDECHVSLIGKLGGTKDSPIPLKTCGASPYEVTIQEDNVAGELGWRPSKKSAEWSAAVQAAQSGMFELINDMGLWVSEKASVLMPDEQLNDPRAFIFGCEPDFNAWTGEINPRPFSEEPRLRSAGGHIHIGIEATDSEKMALVRYLDYYLGFVLATKDPDVRRRSLYGRAGAMRFKPYGVEYRTPSNWWFVNPGNEALVYDLVSIAVEAWQDKTTPHYFDNMPEALNHHDNDLIDQLKAGLERRKALWYA